MQKNEQISGKKVVVGLSGGVDSSVCAYLLKTLGYDVVGLHMKNANQETEKDDENAVKNICKKLNIPCEIVEYDNEMQAVKDYFVSEYKNGRTPNPCVVCNKQVKFKPFLDYCEKIGADFFATGHYAKIAHTENGAILLSAKDNLKDQTYFLNQLSQKQLSKALFPLGELTKGEVRKIAEDNGFVNANKKDSYDICFLDNKKFKDYAEKFMPSKSGDIIDTMSRKVIGKHSGLAKYTIGQRKGLGIGGGHGETGDAWFVCEKDIKNNILYVSQGNDDMLYSKSLVCGDFNWIHKPENDTFDCEAKFRYRQNYQSVSVEVVDNKVKINFKEKQRAITLGQYAVLYKKVSENDYECIGGGVIDEIIK